MKTLLLGSAATVLAIGLACAQTPAAAPSNTAPTAGAPPPTSMAAPKDAASGNSNQAVATTHANADRPAKGANSFTEGEARSRIAGKGFSNVTGLTKDHDGIWRGKAQKDGQPTDVWLDYKGNVGQTS